ncbi:MAG: ABC transporter ATP-binding protein [Eubacteriales bacterium]|nr:ABC transporter ATP-binding protein [Eubacteriales bacterium]
MQLNETAIAQNAVISVENLSKRYGDKLAVDNVSFHVDRGEIVGFLGRNGAGKTTTMNMLTGYISSSGGSAKVDGFDVLSDPFEVKKRIGYLPEQPPLYMDMTVNEYLTFCCNIKNVTKAQRASQMDDVCETMNIQDMRKRMIKNLSKGYKQRVGMAQALLANPQVLILDEPTVGLDPRQIIEIRNLIKRLGKAHTIILSSHILNEVEDVCERVIIIDRGQIVAQDTMANLARSIGNISRMTVRVLGADKQVMRAIHGVDGVTMVDELGVKEEGCMDYIIECTRAIDVRKGLFFALAKLGKPIMQLRPHDVTLEDIFLQLTTADNSESEEKN